MALYNAYTCIVEYLFGCKHTTYTILNVDIDFDLADDVLTAIYFVNAVCDKCGDKCCHMLKNLDLNDSRVIKTAEWLSEHGKSFMGRDRYEEILGMTLASNHTFIIEKAKNMNNMNE